MMREHQPPGRIRAPRLYSSLERSQGGIRELAGILRLKPLEELLGGPIRLYIQPGSNARPDGLEGVRSGPL